MKKLQAEIEALVSKIQPDRAEMERLSEEMGRRREGSRSRRAPT